MEITILYPGQYL